MTLRILCRSLALLAVSLLLPLSCAQAAPALKSIENFAAGMKRSDGFVPLYWDADEARVYIQVSDGEQALFFTTLTQGLGSSDVGLDRGQVSDAHLVQFHRVGRRVLLEQANAGFRADTANPMEKLAVQQSFASSTLFGFDVVAASGEHLLLDATDFVVRDGHGAAAQIAQAGQGRFVLDPGRSAVAADVLKAFPRNTELEATLTFTSDDPGKFVQDVAPTPQAVTLREHYSFVELPPPGFKAREARPGDGYFPLTYENYAAPLGQDITRRLIVRHRLQKKDPAAAISDAVNPIVYYIDPGAPQPIRDALMLGASWWEQAFEAAGYRNAFKVEVLPDGTDPMDARYNIIQWVHRATRGWSYGAAVVDPRTGEIIKGNVTLGSLRARYDYLLAEGLLAPYADGAAPSDAMHKLVLARLAQLAAHELGHTLGLAHNYIASTQGRSSVMDYPVPLLSLPDDGQIDLRQAYATGIGDWDKVTIAYGYQDFPKGTDENKALAAILADARARGLTFLTDQDARPAGASDPDVNLWDNGTDVAAELRHLLAVRQQALARFGDGNIKPDTPLATIEDVLVPIYLYHRYQVDAAAKAVGGQRYTFAMRGDGQTPLERVPAAQQRDAIDALIEALAPAGLALPQPLLDRIPPRPPGYPASPELFSRYTGLNFDAITPAVTASQMVIDNLLQPQRDARLIEQQALDSSMPGLDEVIKRLIAQCFDARTADGYQAEIQRSQQVVLLRSLMNLASTADMPQVRFAALQALTDLDGRLQRQRGGSAAESRQRSGLIDMMASYRSDGIEAVHYQPLEPVPGSPLGD